MIRSSLLTLAASAFLAAPALAFQCPTDIAQINAALNDTMLSPSTKAKVIALRDQGAAQHRAGSHSASVATLAEAKRLLGIGRGRRSGSEGGGEGGGGGY